MGALWVKISGIYFILGIGVGMFMSASLQLQWAAGHAHVNLVGWVSMGIFGAIYSIYPEAGNNTLGKWHFWLYQLGAPILLISMFLIQMLDVFSLGFVHILTFLGGAMVSLGVILFIINCFINVQHKNAALK